MTPAARVQAAIEIVEAWLSGRDGLDRVLSAWGRAHRFAGSKDRRAIADLVYDAMRRRRSAAWVAGGDEGSVRDVLRGSLMLDGGDPAAIFGGARFAPAPLSPAEQAPARSLSGAPRAVKLDYPDWLDVLLADQSDEGLSHLRTRAPVDLRVNLLKATPAEAADALAAEGIETAPVEGVDTALRVTAGAQQVTRGAAFAEGLVEVQDAASQAVAALADPGRGERIMDLCAGGGGKTLAMAALAGGKGDFLAHDISRARMADLPGRAVRAGVSVSLLDKGGLRDQAGRCDLVMIDAPCTGAGAWRRNPDAKWRLTPARLDELTGIQAGLIRQGAGYVAPGGRLVYATCSILPPENETQVAAFLEASDGAWRLDRAHGFPLGAPGDGFFAAVLVRT